MARTHLYSSVHAQYRCQTRRIELPIAGIDGRYWGEKGMAVGCRYGEHMAAVERRVVREPPSRTPRTFRGRGESFGYGHDRPGIDRPTVLRVRGRGPLRRPRGPIRRECPIRTTRTGRHRGPRRTQEVLRAVPSAR